MEDFMEFLVTVGFICLMVYASKKKKEKKAEELKQAEVIKDSSNRNWIEVI